VALATAGPAEAQYFGRNKVRYDRLDFRVLQTEHFDIYYYPEEEDATRHAARMAERWYARFSQVLHHSFAQRQTLVLYASHPHFTQTNVTPGSPGEGVGGLAERIKSRIAMPFASGLGATDHVLGHEIAHAFQIDIAKAAGQDAFLMPGWFIEGMAEYLSVGPADAHTAMWVRDAVAHDRLPTLEKLNDPSYFPYRYGHALWSYLTDEYGDDVLGQVLRSKARGALARLADVTGVPVEELTKGWHVSMAEPDRQRSNVAAPASLEALAADGARLHLAPALSPDGRQLMFLSERDRLSLDLFVADAATGAVIRKVLSTAADPHFDSLQYIASSGAWDAAGRRFAMAALSGGNPVLVIVDAAAGDARTEIPLDGLGEAYNPSWSPDGTRIVFSALKGGLSDLFIYNLVTGTVEQLTADAFADLHPAWSPRGDAIAFATDRFTTRLADLKFGDLRIGVLDLASGAVVPLQTDHAEAKQVSPQWSPAADAVYYISNSDGVSNVYRVGLASGDVRRVTDVSSGVSGITATSPALAVASKSGTLAFSVYRNGRYDIEMLDAAAAASGPVVNDERINTTEEPVSEASLLATLLHDPMTGLPSAASPYPSVEYDDRLRLESIAPPFIGGAAGAGFGGMLRATFGVSFADVLRDRQLQAVLRIGTDVDDLALQAAYTNRKGQWNWGVAAGVMPSRFVGARRAVARLDDVITRETGHLRYLHEWGKATAHYHVNRAQRVELSAGVRRIGFEWQHITRVIDAAAGKTLSRTLSEAPAGAAVILGEANAAFVHDTTVSGPTGPVIGQRLRLEVEPAFGKLEFADVRLDARRYFMPIRPVTFAVRAEHVGRYGPDASDPRLAPLVLALQSRVRGYDLRNFAADECGRSATRCSPLDELTNGRLALLNLEVRAPLAGLLRGQVDYGRLPIEAIVFVDAGFLWTRRADLPVEFDRFRSAGAGARANVGGFLFELTAVRPFDRARTGWTYNLLLRPGW
jgi:Tol biopolymer transport system component